MKAKERLLKSRDVAWILDWSPDGGVAFKTTSLQRATAKACVGLK